MLLEEGKDEYHSMLEVESKKASEINHFTILSALFQSDFYVLLMLLKSERKMQRKT